jgi:hypothetical protein
MFNTLFGFGGIANAGLTASQAYKGPSRNTTRKNSPVVTKTTVMYTSPAELEALKEEWTVKPNTEAYFQNQDTDKLDELFKDYLKTKKLTFLDFSKKRIAKERFNIIDTATSQYLELIKAAMREKAIMMLAGKTEEDLRKLIGETNTLISQASISASKAPDDERIDWIVEKEHYQFFLTLLKEALQMKKTNKYVPSSMEAPALNTSYLNERNFNSRKGMNNMVLSSSMGRNKNLTNRQKNARRIVAMKMAKGEPVTYAEKYNAGIVKMPKPSMPKPNASKPAYPKPAYPKPTGPKPIAVGGKKTRRNRKQ